MKYLKHFESYLRKGTEIISEDDAQDLLYDLEHFNGDDEPIFRGMKISESPDEIFIIDPKKHTRESAYTQNYYTLLIDNSPLWKDYPKRSKSLICSSIEVDESYGQSYRIIPLDKKSNWGIAPENDLWFSFPKIDEIGFNDLSMLNSFLLNTFVKRNIGTIDELNVELGKATEEIRKLTEQDIAKEMPYQKMFLTFFKKETKDKSLKDVIEDLLNPKENGFKNMKYKKLKDSEYLLDFDRGIKHELWTDAKCLCVPSDIYDIDNMNSLVKKQEIW
jgi:hypothetical protein